VSLLASCSLHKIEPFAYMRDLLCLVPRWPSHRVLELAPAYWRETLEKREAHAAHTFAPAPPTSRPVTRQPPSPKSRTQILVAPPSNHRAPKRFSYCQHEAR
jgi:hypothetical protein